MFDAHRFLLFLAAAVLLAITPGPGIFYVLARSLAGGRREGILSSFGAFIGGLFHVLAAALGVSAILAASAVAFHTVKYAGAGYLVWLGIRMIRSRNAETPVTASQPPSTGAFRQGILTEVLNPKTARSQIMGGIVWGIGMALEEESVIDQKFGRFMNHNLAEYHVPVNADVHDIDVIFVEEHDSIVNPLGVKGLGEIGIVGTGAAIGNAVFHATGVRVRELPITLDKLLITRAQERGVLKPAA